MIKCRGSLTLQRGYKLCGRAYSVKTISEAAKELAEGSLTSQKLVDECLRNAEAGAALNAFISRREEDARREARASDEKGYGVGGRRNPLQGIPIAVKDNFCVEGSKTTNASRMLQDFVSPYTATVVQKLQSAGAVIVGKTNMDEFAMGYFGPAVNPHPTAEGERTVPGGSSGGSAVAVAAGMCLGALGSDTGGSVRLPAAFCGIVGLKPTYGRCSRFGLTAYASSLDVPGILARTVEDAALILECISGADERDATTADAPASDLILPDSPDISGLTVGIPEEYYVAELATEIHSAWMAAADWLAARGARVLPVSLPYTKAALPTYYILAPAEASSNLARYDGVRFGHRAAATDQGELPYEATRGEGFGREVRDRILLGTFCLSRNSYESYYVKAQQVRRLIREDFTRVFDAGVDVLLTPTATATAPTFAEWSRLTPLEKNANDVFTVPASLAGLPAMSIPAGRGASALPIGLQVIGQAFGERAMLHTGRALEQFAAGL